MDLTSPLQSYFGHRQFRPGQQRIVDAVLGGHDVLAVMPTGSGKSLCYQLPAVMLPGMTLVVSPLISLIKDQVDELNRRGVAAGALHSMLEPASKRDVLATARRGALRLLYIAPERFASDAFAELLSEIPVARFVVDEAHYGRHRIVSMLAGDTRDLPAALTRLSTTGLLRHEPPDALRAWLDACIVASLVRVSADRYGR